MDGETFSRSHGLEPEHIVSTPVYMLPPFVGFKQEGFKSNPNLYSYAPISIIPALPSVLFNFLPKSEPRISNNWLLSEFEPASTQGELP